MVFFHKTIINPLAFPYVARERMINLCFTFYAVSQHETYLLSTYTVEAVLVTFAQTLAFSRRTQTQHKYRLTNGLPAEYVRLMRVATGWDFV